MTSVILEKYSPEVANKVTRHRHGVARSITKRRDLTTLRPEGIEGASTIPVDVTDAPRESYQFLLKYKCLTASQNHAHLELLERHLEKIVPASSGHLQAEIFKKIILGIFSAHIPEFSSETCAEPVSVHLIEICLKFLPNFLLDDELFQVFAQKDGISSLQILSRNDHLAPFVFEALRQISQRKPHRIASNAESKSVRIFKDLSQRTKPSAKVSNDLSFETISLKATESLLECGKKLITDVYQGPVALDDFEEAIVWSSKGWANLLNLLVIYNGIQMDSLDFKERLAREDWPKISFNLVKASVSIIDNFLYCDDEDALHRNEQLGFIMKLCLPTIRAALPICFSFCTDESNVSMSV